MNLRACAASAAALLLVLLVLLGSGCAMRPTGDTSPELGRITEPGGDVVRYTVRAGGRIEKARLAPEPDAYLGATLKPAPRGRFGAQVGDLMHGGPAAVAGLEIGDVILAYGGARVRTPDELRAAVLYTPRDATVEVRYRREQELREAAVEFRERREAVASREDLPDLEHHLDRGRSGIEVVTVPEDLAARLLRSDTQRVVVTSVAVGSPGYHAGIRPGDRLLAADGRRLAGAADFAAVVRDGESGRKVMFTVAKGEEQFEAGVRLVDLDRTTYRDLPVLFHHVANAEGASTHVGSILFVHESRPLPTSRREGARNLDVSLLLGLIRWEERRRESGLRLFWLLPIGW